jgi:hypothetical protein
VDVFPQLTKRRVIGTLVFLAVFGVGIVAAGQFWITHSEPYELGREAVGSRLGVLPGSVVLKRLAPYEFVDGDFHGEATFVLCGQASKCFTVVAKKRDARWNVMDLVER